MTKGASVSGAFWKGAGALAFAASNGCLYMVLRSPVPVGLFEDSDVFYGWVVLVQYAGAALVLLPSQPLSRALVLKTSSFLMVLAFFLFVNTEDGLVWWLAAVFALYAARFVDVCVGRSWTEFLYGVRTAVALLGVGTFYAALGTLSLVETILLGLCGPAVSVVLARVFLKERVGSRRLVAIGVSALGLFLIGKKPETGRHVSVLFPIISSVFFSITNVLTKALIARGENPTVVSWRLLAGLGFNGLLCFVVFFKSAGPVEVFRHAFVPHWPWFCGTVAATAFGHFAIARAFSKADLTFLIPFGAVRCFGSLAIGVLCFGQSLSLLAIFGGALVALSNWWLLRREV